MGSVNQALDKQVAGLSTQRPGLARARQRAAVMGETAKSRRKSMELSSLDTNEIRHAISTSLCASSVDSSTEPAVLGGSQHWSERARTSPCRPTEAESETGMENAKEAAEIREASLDELKSQFQAAQTALQGLLDTKSRLMAAHESQSGAYDTARMALAEAEEERFAVNLNAFKRQTADLLEKVKVEYHAEGRRQGLEEAQTNQTQFLVAVRQVCQTLTLTLTPTLTPIG